MGVCGLTVPRTLKNICLSVMGQNKWMRDHKGDLYNLPECLVVDLCQYISPYGLYILEEVKTSLSSYSDHLFLTQWAFPSSYALKARTRCREITTSLHSGISNKQFFYDSLLNEVIEQLMYGQSIDRSLEQAWSYFTQCPIESDYYFCYWDTQLEFVDDSDSNESLGPDSNLEFMNMLSSSVVTLTITLLVSHRIVEHYSTFYPILHTIRHINLNLLIKSTRHQSIEESIDIIKIARKNQLSSISIKLSNESVLNQHECFMQLNLALVSPLNNKNCEAQNNSGESSRTLIRKKDDYIDDLDDELYTEDIYENFTVKRHKSSATDSTDLFDYVFETYDNSTEILIDTGISALHLSACENPFYGKFFDYIAQWETLQKLCIEGYNPDDDTKIRNAFLALDRYNMLKDLTLYEFWLPTSHAGSYDSENALIRLARSSCSVHGTIKSLKKLKLRNCCYSDKFLHSILSQYCNHLEEQCAIEGLDSLEVALFRSSDLALDYLTSNSTLKEIIIHQSVFADSEDHFLDAISQTKLRTFILGSTIKPPFSTPPHILGLLENVNLYHLQLTRVCDSKNFLERYCLDSWKDRISSFMLTVLIWTHNGLGNDGLVNSVHFLTCLRHLKVLDLSGNLFNIAGVSPFLQALHDHRYYLDKLSLGGPNVRSEDIVRSGLFWIVDKYINLFLGSYLDVDTSDHVAEM